MITPAEALPTSLVATWLPTAIERYRLAAGYGERGGRVSRGRIGTGRTKVVALVCTLAGAAGTLLVTGLANTIAQSDSAAPGQTAIRDDPESGGLLFVQNATGGFRVGGQNRFRLVLERVDPHGLYFSDRPRRIAGILTVPEMLTTLGFGSGEPNPNAVLQVETGLGIDAVPVELSEPRYVRERNRLSFTARRLKAAGTTARTPFRRKLDRFGETLDGAIPAHFGRASLFIDDGGNDCQIGLKNSLGVPLTLTQAVHKDHDSWKPSGGPPGTIAPGQTAYWRSEGGFARGCSQQVVYSSPSGQPFTFEVDNPYGHDPTSFCATGGGSAACQIDPTKGRAGIDFDTAAVVCDAGGDCSLPSRDPPEGTPLG